MDVREVRSLTLAGGVLHVGTVLGVLSLTARSKLPWVVPLFLLLASPLVAAAGLYVTGIRAGALQTPSSTLDTRVHTRVAGAVWLSRVVQSLTATDTCRRFRTLRHAE